MQTLEDLLTMLEVSPLLLALIVIYILLFPFLLVIWLVQKTWRFFVPVKEKPRGTPG